MNSPSKESVEEANKIFAESISKSDFIDANFILQNFTIPIAKALDKYKAEIKTLEEANRHQDGSITYFTDRCEMLIKKADDSLSEALRLNSVATQFSKQIASLTSRLNVAREVLQTINDTCEEEIKVRSAGLSESKLKNLKVISLLEMPRNFAKEALQKIQEEK